MRRITLIMAGLLVLAGCASNFVPFNMALAPLPTDEARSGFPSALIEHLAKRRDVPLARDVLSGLNALLGILQTEDGNHTVLVLYSDSAKTLALPYAYVYIALGPGAGIVFHENTSPLSGGYSMDAGENYRGVYRLTLRDSMMCYGETSSVPRVEGNSVVIVPSNRSIRRSLKEHMENHYTPTRCFGGQAEPGQGVRFYFDTPEDMKGFADTMSGALPGISVSKATP